MAAIKKHFIYIYLIADSWDGNDGISALKKTGGRGLLLEI